MSARRKPTREREPRAMTRREFLWTLVAAGGAFAGWQGLSRRSFSPRGFKAPNTLAPELAVARNPDHYAATMLALSRLGGLGRLVAPGDVVCIKPNIAWSNEPQYANNTNPEVVAAVVKAALDAGAGRVRVFDYTLEEAGMCYQRSGIADAVARVGHDRRVQLVYVSPATDFVALEVPGGQAIKAWGFYRPALECDVFINVPVLKHHSQSGLTIGLKALFGLAGPDTDPRFRRGSLHQDIHRTIVDLNRVIKTDLTVLDATRVLTANGPGGRSLRNVKVLDTVVAGTDRVAVDAFGADLFGRKPERVGFIRNADGVLEIPGGKLGRMDYGKVGVLEA